MIPMTDSHITPALPAPCEALDPFKGVRGVAAIVDRFGGTRAMARAGGWPASTVQSWKRTGRIPALRQPEVLRAARREGIKLTPADFFPVVGEGSPPPAATPWEGEAP